MTTDYQKLPETVDYKGTYAFISLGCPKNTVDSERMMGLLKLDGYRLVPDPVGSDFVIVNTCGFIEQARQESFAAIDEMLNLKRAGKTRGVIVSGCLAERQKEQLRAERPDIDNLVGVFGREQITAVVDRMLGDLQEQRSVFQPAPIRALADLDRLRITPAHFGYLKISEGCDRLCTFCAIPRMRGKHASKPLETVVAEAQELADSGVRELIVVAQDTTYYGIDLYGEPRLSQLLGELNGVKGLEWIRLMYFYPMYIDHRLIQTMAECDKVLPYIDMPLQHINDTVLRRMNRKVNRQQTEEIIDQLRAGIPNLALRTTLITGFPGETDQQFAELSEFVSRQKFERLGVFTYSYESDTPSAKMPEHLEETKKNARRQRIMEIQQRVAFERNAGLVGSTLPCMIDRPVSETENGKQLRAWVARSQFDAPDVDALVYVTENEAPLRPGDIVDCEIVQPQEYDLIGVAVSEAR